MANGELVKAGRDEGVKAGKDEGVKAGKNSLALSDFGGGQQDAAGGSGWMVVAFIRPVTMDVAELAARMLHQGARDRAFTSALSAASAAAAAHKERTRSKRRANSKRKTKPSAR